MMHITRDTVELPALVTAHSHAFQRALRGHTQRPGPTGMDDFWSWRTAMYALADSLTPESIYEISLVAYRELHRAGVRTVGEFHYVHHQPGGIPYEDRTILADAVIRAARDARLRIALLRVIYARAGAGKPPLGAQRRFCDANLDDALSDLDTLVSRYGQSEDVRIGIAPHSIRAVPINWFPEIAKYADQHQMMVHAHVAEQMAEIQACIRENGVRPVQLLADNGLLGPRFVAVHATHLDKHEPELLGSSGAFVCICSTTERDLGDGLPDINALYSADVKLCMGVDSHVITNPLEDLRGIELGERLRTTRRIILGSNEKTPAEELWHIGSQLGAQACGFSDPGSTIVVDRNVSELALVPEDHLLDAIVFSASPGIFRARNGE